MLDSVRVLIASVSKLEVISKEEPGLLLVSALGERAESRPKLLPRDGDNAPLGDEASVSRVLRRLSFLKEKGLPDNDAAAAADADAESGSPWLTATLQGRMGVGE